MVEPNKHEESHSEYAERMRLRRRQVLKAFAIGGSVGVASFLAACAPPPPPTPTPAPPPKPAEAPKPAPPPPPTATTAPTATAAPKPTEAPKPTAAPPTATPAPAPTAAPKPAEPAIPAALADALRLNLGSEPETIDPGRASFVGEIEVIMRVFSNSYTFDSKAQLVPDQAEAMPQISADGKTITVKLKKGLVWSDGKPLTAKQFVFGTLRQLNPNTAGDYAFTLYPIKGAEAYNTADPKKASADELKKLREAVGVKAPDDTTLVYTLEEVTPWFLSVLATWNGLPLRDDLVTAGGKPEENQDWIKPDTYIGNGPYKLTKHEPNVQMVFEANEKYVNGAPPLKKVQFFMIKDTTVAFAAYRAGNLDRTGVNSLTKDAVDKDAALKAQMVLGPGHCTFYLGFNTKLPPFDNMKVRQAFAAAFDRKTFVEQVMKGLALPSEQFLPPGFPGYYTDIVLQKTDPAKGKQLLAEAGFPNGQGLPAVKFTFSSTDLNKLLSGAAQAMFKQNLNVTVQLDPVEPKAFTALVKKQETTPQMFRLGWCQDYPDPQNWYSTVFHSTSTISHTGWKSEKFDSLTKEADHITDNKKRDALYQQAATILNTEAPVAFTHHDVDAFLLKPEVQGYKHDPFEYFFGQHSLKTIKVGR